MPEALREEAHSLFMELSTVPATGAEQAGKGQLSDGGLQAKLPSTPGTRCSGTDTHHLHRKHGTASQERFVNHQQEEGRKEE